MIRTGELLGEGTVVVMSVIYRLLLGFIYRTVHRSASARGTAGRRRQWARTRNRDGNARIQADTLDHGDGRVDVCLAAETLDMGKDHWGEKVGPVARAGEIVHFAASSQNTPLEGLARAGREVLGSCSEGSGREGKESSRVLHICLWLVRFDGGTKVVIRGIKVL